MKLEIDEFDIKILDILQRNNRLPLESIAEEVCLSFSAVQRRLGKLRKSGIIKSEVAVLSPEALGQKLTAVIEVTLEQENPTTLKEFNLLMIKTPEVMQCYYVTGEADFVIIMTAEDMQDFDSLTTRIFSENPLVKKFRTGIVVKTVKAGLSVPLRLERVDEKFDK